MESRRREARAYGAPDSIVTTRFSLPDSHYPILTTRSYSHYPILTTRSYSHYQILFSLPDLLFSILLRLACPETVRDGEDGPLQAVESISGLRNQFCHLHGVKEQQIHRLAQWIQNPISGSPNVLGNSQKKRQQICSGRLFWDSDVRNSVFSL